MANGQYPELLNTLLDIQNLENKRRELERTTKAKLNGYMFQVQMCQGKQRDQIRKKMTQLIASADKQVIEIDSRLVDLTIRRDREQLQQIRQYRDEHRVLLETEQITHSVVCTLARHQDAKQHPKFYKIVAERHWNRCVIQHCSWCRDIEHLNACEDLECTICEGYWIRDGVIDIIHRVMSCPDKHCDLCTRFLWPDVHTPICSGRSCMACVEYVEFDDLFCDVCFRIQSWGQGRRCHFECTVCRGYCSCSEQCRVCGHYICTDGLSDVICLKCEKLELAIGLRRELIYRPQWNR